MYNEHFGRDETEERNDETDEIEQRAGTDTEEWPEETEKQHVFTEEETEGRINEMLQNENQDDTEAGTEDVIEIEDDGFNVGDFVC